MCADLAGRAWACAADRRLLLQLQAWNVYITHLTWLSAGQEFHLPLPIYLQYLLTYLLLLGGPLPHGGRGGRNSIFPYLFTYLHVHVHVPTYLLTAPGGPLPHGGGGQEFYFPLPTYMYLLTYYMYMYLLLLGGGGLRLRVNEGWGCCQCVFTM